MDETADEIAAAIARLRGSHTDFLATMRQAKIVGQLSAWATRWQDPDYPPRREVETWQEPFPFRMVQVSLDALLASLAEPALWSLIDAEGVRGVRGYPVTGHVIAGNTPLLAWVSVIRALLVRSASIVKLPSGPAGAWGRVFVQTLADAAPDLAACVHLSQWPGGTTDRDSTLCGGVDLVMAHGSDETMRALRAVCPATTPFVGYGHRVSFGLVTRGSAGMGAAMGLSRDVLLYDQGGCLSPQTIFVEGDWNDAVAFAEQLAGALPDVAARYPLPVRAERAAAVVREARELAWMGEGNQVWEDPGLRWTVTARPDPAFVPSPTYGVVSVQPLASLEDLPEALGPVAGCLQGCAVAGEAKGYLPGVSYLGAPGELQAPPLAWRQDGRDVLRVLIPPRPYRADGMTTTRGPAGSVSAETSSAGTE